MRFEEITKKRYNRIQKNDYDSYGRVKMYYLKEYLICEDNFSYKWAFTSGLGIFVLSIIRIRLLKKL